MPEIIDKQRYVLPFYREVYDFVTKAACENFDITPTILKEDKTRQLSYIRHLCFYLLKNNFNELSFDDIGKEFNITEHPTRFGFVKIDAQKNIYGGIMADLTRLCSTVNSFEGKKFVWILKVDN